MEASIKIYRNLLPTLILSVVIAGSVFGATTIAWLISNNGQDTGVVESQVVVSYNGHLPINEERATILVVGDIMLGRYVETLMNKEGQDYPFAGTKQLLSMPDLVVGNLEGPIVADHKQTPDYSLSFNFSSGVAKALSNNGVDIVTLANNHTYDNGSAAFDYTRKVLDDSEISWFGHPREESRDYIKEIEVNGYKLRFYGFNYAVRSSFDRATAVDLVKSMSDESFDIVSIHWGGEYQSHSNQVQQELAHQLIDNGADLILGHHSHVLQETELYKDKLIFYSLGNFIFDQYFSKETQETVAVQLQLNNGGVEYHLIPIYINRSQPQIMSEENGLTLLKSIADRSSKTIQEGIIMGDIPLSY
ncbi:MAG: CapA family protein [Patescibacteria group bacterium]